METPSLHSNDSAVIRRELHSTDKHNEQESESEEVILIRPLEPDNPEITISQAKREGQQTAECTASEGEATKGGEARRGDFRHAGGAVEGHIATRLRLRAAVFEAEAGQQLGPVRGDAGGGGQPADDGRRF